LAADRDHIVRLPSEAGGMTCENTAMPVLRVLLGRGLDDPPLTLPYRT
jgi:hypothetical protein